MGCRIQHAGCRWSARRVSGAASVRGIVRKNNCALPTLHPKHSNARGALIRVRVRVRVSLRVRVRFRVIIRVRARVGIMVSPTQKPMHREGGWG